MAKKLAVIILNWNGRELLRKFLPELVAHTTSPDVDLIVADNGSTDDSREIVRREFPSVTLMELGENHGFAEGYNIAISRIGNPYCVLLNSDVQVTAGWWQPLLAHLEAHPHTAAVQPKIRSFRNPEQFEYAGAAGGYLDWLGYPYCRGRLFDIVETDNGQYDGAPAPVAWASGAALAVRTEVYRALGGLDKDFFAHMEEIDLCCRMLAAGWRVEAITDSHVFHVGGASLPKENPKKTYLNFRNNLLLLHKNLPKTKGRIILFLRRMADTLALAMFLAKGDTANARAIWDAHRDFRRMKRKYTTFPARDILHTLPGSHRLIVLDKFLLRKKK